MQFGARANGGMNLYVEAENYKWLKYTIEIEEKWDTQPIEKDFVAILKRFKFLESIV